MAERVGPPGVLTVDTYSSRPPPIPPRSGRRAARRSLGAAQSLLFLLVAVALCGVVIEAFCILQLYKKPSASSESTSKLTAGEDVWRSRTMHPAKPTAHLTYGTDVVHAPQVMRWSMTARHLLHQVGYDNNTGSLVIQKEGFYQVYSKVSFRATHVFHHSVAQKTSRYKGAEIPLLTARKYSAPRHQEGSTNSYLGGVFHLQVNDTIFVKVRDTSQLERYDAYEHVFGAYML